MHGAVRVWQRRVGESDWRKSRVSSSSTPRSSLQPAFDFQTQPQPPQQVDQRRTRTHCGGSAAGSALSPPGTSPGWSPAAPAPRSVGPAARRPPARTAPRTPTRRGRPRRPRRRARRGARASPYPVLACRCGRAVLLLLQRLVRRRGAPHCWVACLNDGIPIVHHSFFRCSLWNRSSAPRCICRCLRLRDHGSTPLPTSEAVRRPPARSALASCAPSASHTTCTHPVE